MGEKMKKDLDDVFKAELVNIEQDNDKLKIVFKVTAEEPLLFFNNNKAVAVTEIHDIYELDLHVFPATTLRYWMKHVATINNTAPLAQYIIDLDTLGFGDYNEFKQFIIKHPTYVRYLGFIYHIFAMRPWLFLLYISTFSYKHNIKISEREIQITIEKVRISNYLKKYEVDEKITFKLLKNHDSALLMIGNAYIADFGGVITFNEITEILEEKPNAILNTLLLLILTLFF